MFTIFLSGVLAFFVTLLAIPSIIQVAKEKKLFDEPDDRKIHKTVIPTLGGLGVFAGFILSLLLMASNSSGELQYFVAAAILLFFLGIKDDILIISPAKKLIGQFLAAGILVQYGDLQITDLFGFMGVFQLAPIASIPFTLLTIVFLINSFNLIDGVDGLVGSIGLLTSLFFGAYFLFTGQPFYAIIGFSLAGSLLAFLLFNFSPASIFMGDTGSLLIGVVNAIMAIKFIVFASNKDGAIPLASSPALAIGILIIPIFDTIRVFGLRILNKRSPFSPDRTHIHHFLLDLGFSHRKVTLICVLVNVGFISLVFLLRNLGTTFLIGIVMTIAFALMGLVHYKRSILLSQTSKDLQDKRNLLPSFPSNLLAPKTVKIN